jgi:aminoglycoside/choline kinase family phosphotransferase
MPDRSRIVAAFLAAHGWGQAVRRPLAEDASFRRYERLTLGSERAVLMDADPDEEDVRPFVRMARHLKGLGLSAPEIIARDEAAGLVLEEDLGDDTYTRVLAAGGDEGALYATAVDVLIDLHRRADAVPAGLPGYGNGRLLDEAFLLPQWYLPAMEGRPAPEASRRSYGEAWLSLFPTLHAQPRTLVLRDFHVDNLMVLPGRSGIAACGLLDFQDAVAGPAAYDLMSLLEDARRDLEPGLIGDMLGRYRAAFPNLDGTSFETAYTILAAQRHAKVIGIFTRLSVRDGKPAYLAHIPRVWRLLEAALEHPALDAVRDWFDRHVSGRGIPSAGAAAP